MQRGRDRLRNYIPPPPERTEEEKAAYRRSDPSTWKLRGAARPWEEVEAAKTRDHHDVGFDALERYGGELASQVEEGAKWVQSLVDLARDELEPRQGARGSRFVLRGADVRLARLVGGGLLRRRGWGRCGRALGAV